MVLFKKENGKEHFDRLKHEFESIIDPRLKAVYLELGTWMYNRYGFPLVVTSLIRTVEENAKVNGSKYSAHLFGRGGDSRIHGMSESVIDEIEKHLLETWNSPKRKPFLYVICHDSGSGNHIHTNITWAYSIKNYAS